MTRFCIFRENFQADTWDALPQIVSAETEERAVRAYLSGRSDIFGTYVAIPTDELTQFMENRTRFAVSAHFETFASVEA